MNANEVKLKTKVLTIDIFASLDTLDEQIKNSANNQHNNENYLMENAKQ